MNKDQYAVVASRRQGYDTLLWQMPAIGIAAQSFLITASLDADTPEFLAVVLAASSCFVAFASIQFFQRLRFMELYDAELLREFESQNASAGYAVVHGRKDGSGEIKAKGLARLRAYPIWNSLLAGFCVLALSSLGLTVLRLLT
jgi:hypothetical protein